jgi:hypothetical protein
MNPIPVEQGTPGAPCFGPPDLSAEVVSPAPCLHGISIRVRSRKVSVGFERQVLVSSPASFPPGLLHATPFFLEVETALRPS